MLLHLQVKNLALIDQAEVEFGPGLNIMTGETGAGKSVIIGSVNAALGGKASRDMIRQGAEYAYIELVFHETDPRILERLAEEDITPDEDGMIVITRKITAARSVSRINDEAVSAARMKAATSLLIDIHGQHDHQSLLHKAKHLEILDAYAKNSVGALRETVAAEYREYQRLTAALSAFTQDEEQRSREMDFLQFEIDEIGSAGIRPGEEEELAALYRRMSNAQRIEERIGEAVNLLDDSGSGRILTALEDACRMDESLSGIRDMAYDLEALEGDLRRELDSYLDGFSFDEETYAETESRLELIRRLEKKYGPAEEDVLAALDRKKKRLEMLLHYDEQKEEAARALRASEERLKKASEELSAARRKAAASLTRAVQGELADLNFLDARFEMQFTELDHYTAGGTDEAEFMISANPGEPVRPLMHAASGGELSRIMLAIKTVLAETDEIPTLIFDEIDTGISGRTAQKVSEQLGVIAGRHQVICITHLPQIAAMADQHFEIRKMVEGDRTVTRIRKLTRSETTEELARLLGGAKITGAVLETAAEMKELADRTKKERMKPEA